MAEPAESRSEPGPPPLPPADLSLRRLPLHTCPAGAALARIHPRDLGAVFFGPAAGSPPRGRWDAPDGEFGVCYLAEAPHVAFAETFLRRPGVPVVERVDLATRALARVEVRRELRLVALHGEGLARVGATAAVCSGPYAVSRAWSRALHAHPGAPDGIRYRARHDDDGFALALFSRASWAIDAGASWALDDPVVAPHLGEWLDRYGIGLI